MNATGLRLGYSEVTVALGYRATAPYIDKGRSSLLTPNPTLILRNPHRQSHAFLPCAPKVSARGKEAKSPRVEADERPYGQPEGNPQALERGLYPPGVCKESPSELRHAQQSKGACSTQRRVLLLTFHNNL